MFILKPEKKNHNKDFHFVRTTLSNDLHLQQRIFSHALTSDNENYLVLFCGLCKLHEFLCFFSLQRKVNQIHK